MNTYPKKALSFLRRVMLPLLCVVFILAWVRRDRPAAGTDPGRERVRAAPELYRVATLDSGFLVLEVGGRIENKRPDPHYATVEYVPIKWVRFEGERVDVGDPLVEFDTGLVDLWKEQTLRHKVGDEAELELSRSITDKTLSELSVEKIRLQAERNVLLKQIEATRVKDNSQREILRITLDQARLGLNAATQHLARARALHGSGEFSSTYIATAEDVCEKARQAVRLAEFDIEQHDGETGATTRRGLAIDLASLELALGNELSREGVFGEIASLGKLQQLREELKTARIRFHASRLAEYDTMLASRVLAARREGVLMHSPDTPYPLEAGAKQSAVPLAYVIQENDLLLEFFLPVMARYLVRVFDGGAEGHGLAEVTIPALSRRTFRAAVLSLGSIETESKAEKAQGFKCLLRLDELDAELKSGMTIRAKLRVPVAPRTAVIPLWLVSDTRDAAVTLGDGHTVPVTGFALGSRFVVLEGLVPGDVIRAPGGKAKSRVTRLTGRLEPADALHLHLKSSRRHHRGHVIVSEIAPDGAPVKDGDLVFKVAHFAMWAQMRYQDAESRFEKAEYETHLAISRVEAENRLIKAYVDWKKKLLAADKARLKYLVSRYGTFERAQLSANVALTNAILVLAATERTAEQATDDVSGFSSRHANRRAMAKRDAAAVAYEKAELTHFAAMRQRDWLAVRDDETEMAAARLAARTSRMAYGAAETRYRLDLVSAMQGYRSFLRDFNDRMELTRKMAVYAPRDGRIFHTKKAPRVGEDYWSGNVLLMPTSDEWQFEVEIPSRFYGRFEVGQEISFTVPAFEMKPRTGIVKWVAPHFEQSERAAKDQFLRGMLARADPIFRIRVGFTVSPEERMHVAPGLTAFMDLAAEERDDPQS